MRYNLWLTIGDHSKVIVYGTQQDMNDLACSYVKLSDLGDVHVLPDGEEPISICRSTNDSNP
jgi:hypothetical protein